MSVRYPDPESARLVALQDMLAAIVTPETAEFMFGALHRKYGKDPAKLLDQAERCLEAYEADPERLRAAQGQVEAEAAPVDQELVMAERQLAAAASVKARREAVPIDLGDAPEVAAQPAKNRPPRFWIPDGVFAQRLTAQEFVVYAVLCRRAGKSRRCWPSITTIARAGRMNRHTVIAALDALESLGMVECRKRFQKTSVYTLTTSETWRPVVPEEALLGVPIRALLEKRPVVPRLDTSSASFDHQ